MLIVHYKHLDDITSTITVDMKKQTVRVVDYTDNVIDTAFGNYSKNHSLTIGDFYTLLRRRCIPDTREDAKDIFSYILGKKVAEITDSVIFEVVKRTHGCMADDFYSLDFIEIKAFDGTGNKYIKPNYVTNEFMHNYFAPCKGNVAKYKLGNTWYRKDEDGSIVDYSNQLSHIPDIRYISCRSEWIDGVRYATYDEFLDEDEELYRVTDLYQNIRGYSLCNNLSFEHKKGCIIAFMQTMLSIPDADDCITQFINIAQDKSLDNIYVIRKHDTFMLSPYFDYDFI